MRRDFELPEQDLDHLASLGLSWETFREAGNNWLIIHDYPVPPGYNTSKVKVALQILPGYPVAQLDMAYFYPHLQLANQKTIGAISFQPINGNTFQRWSRHRTPANPWRPGVDDLSTHLASVTHWFERELKK
jgi:hypothetical protein